MPSFECGDIESFISIINKVRLVINNQVYRGQSDNSWELIPAAGRKEYFIGIDEDKNIFKKWCNQAPAYSENLPTDELELLAVAQHHGLATRLLDWSDSPLVALFFAVEKMDEKDGEVFIYQPSQWIESTSSIEEIEHLAAYRARAVTSRIVNQSGLFTYHKVPNLCLKKLLNNHQEEMMNPIITVTIPSYLKATIRHQLDVLGVNKVSLFPDLDGLASHLNWRANRQKIDTTVQEIMTGKRTLDSDPPQTIVTTDK